MTPFVSPVAPTQSAIQAALSSFIASILPGVTVVAAQQNRVPEPSSPNFIVMTPIRAERVKTTENDYEDAVFQGTINGTTLSITALSGSVGVGSVVYGSGVAIGTMIVAPGQSSGLWSVSPSQHLSQRTMSAGRKTWTSENNYTIQLDFHSADTSSAGDMAQTFTTMFRTDFAFNQFASQSPDTGVRPLYADDAREMPFINESQQYEWRWVVEARVAVNDVVTLPQQFADSLLVDVISVDATFPP